MDSKEPSAYKGTRKTTDTARSWAAIPNLDTSQSSDTLRPCDTIPKTQKQQYSAVLVDSAPLNPTPIRRCTAVHTAYPKYNLTAVAPQPLGL